MSKRLPGTFDTPKNKCREQTDLVTTAGITIWASRCTTPLNRQLVRIDDFQQSRLPVLYKTHF